MDKQHKFIYFWFSFIFQNFLSLLKRRCCLIGTEHKTFGGEESFPCFVSNINSFSVYFVLIRNVQTRIWKMKRIKTVTTPNWLEILTVNQTETMLTLKLYYWRSNLLFFGRFSILETFIYSFPPSTPIPPILIIIFQKVTWQLLFIVVVNESSKLIGCLTTLPQRCKSRSIVTVISSWGKRLILIYCKAIFFYFNEEVHKYGE